MFFHTGSINYFYTVAFIVTLAKWRSVLQEQEEKVPKSAEPVSPFSSEVVQVQRIVTMAPGRTPSYRTGRRHQSPAGRATGYTSQPQ